MCDYIYSDNVNKDTSLPNIEIFHSDQYDDNPVLEAGWYWWACFPGCLPDSDPVGPFDSREMAVEDATTC